MENLFGKNTVLIKPQDALTPTMVNNIFGRIRCDIQMWADLRGEYPQKIFLSNALYTHIVRYTHAVVVHRNVDGSSNDTLFGIPVSRYCPDFGVGVNKLSYHLAGPEVCFAEEGENA